MAAKFRGAKPNCASFPASVPIRRPPSPRSPSTQHASPVDGNIERVIARLYALETPLPAVKPEIAELARALTPPQRAGDFAQAMMDLGATICTPKNPGLRAVSVERELCRVRPRRRRDLSAPRAKARGRTAPRRGFRRPPRRRIHSVAHASGERSPRRHDRSADHGMVEGFCCERSARPRAAFSQAGLPGARRPASCATSSRISRLNSLSICQRFPRAPRRRRHAVDRDCRT